MTNNTPTVFINYRREDTEWATSLLYEKLTSRLGRAHVFMDIDSILFGEDWETQLRNKVASCDAMLVVIGDKWMAPRQKRRLHDETDHLRQEIEAALAREETRVILLLVGSAKLPRAEDLPESLRPLLKCQSIEIPRAYFGEGVDRLVDTVAAGAGHHEVKKEERVVPSPPGPALWQRIQKPAIAIGGIFVLLVAGLLIKHAWPSGTKKVLQPTPIPTTSTAALVYGPQTSSVNQQNGIMNGIAAGISQKNVTARATFYNPANASKPWDYGFEFRRISVNGEYRIWVDSTKHWHLRYGRGSTDPDGGFVPSLNTSPGGRNDLVLIADGKGGDFFVNGNYAGALNLASRTGPGDVYAATGFLLANIKPGRKIKYTNFSIWTTSTTYFQASGTPIRSGGSGPYSWTSSVSTRDAIVAAQFKSPASTGLWDYGFFFRVTGVNHQYALLVASCGLVRCFRDNGSTKISSISSKQLCSQTVTNLRHGANAINDLHLYVIGRRATLFINGTDTASWNIGAVQRPGDIRLVANDLTSDSQSPVPTFSNFEVWTLDP